MKIHMPYNESVNTFDVIVRHLKLEEEHHKTIDILVKFMYWHKYMAITKLQVLNLSKRISGRDIIVHIVKNAIAKEEKALLRSECTELFCL